MGDFKRETGIKKERSNWVTDKLLRDLESYKEVVGGSIYFGSSQSSYYQCLLWCIEF